MSFYTQATILAVLLLLLLLLLPPALRAQTRPTAADTTRTEPDQELDQFSGGFKGIHVITPGLRGVRGTNRTTYVVGHDGRQLSAYQAGKLLWTTNVARPFLVEIPTVRIASLVLITDLLFVNLRPRGMAEVDRKTGQISGKYFDRDPNHLVAEPN